ncbi:MAG: zf-HC2 domain-containing protein [Acidobacteria bacterium]|nr:zf-HC2 domain-containing protein [Acidobacteriota bacterium]
MMLCEEIQRTFSSYIDDALTLPVRAACERHLEQCPLCRAQLAEVRSLTRRLSSLTRPIAPPDLASSISDALAIEAGALRRAPHLPLGVHLARWLRPRLMPYAVGTFASLILFFTLFSALRPHLVALREAEMASRDAALYRVFVPRNGEFDITQPVSSESLSRSRAPFAVQSPSLNPRGALAALALSKSRGHIGDDDMVVVTDVFSDGHASLAGVVQAPRDPRMLEDFQVALRDGPAFVPASFDRRPQTMRVVFVVQKVSVSESGF